MAAAEDVINSRERLAKGLQRPEKREKQSQVSQSSPVVPVVPVHTASQEWPDLDASTACRFWMA